MRPRSVWRTVRAVFFTIGLAWVLVTVTPVTRWFAAALAVPWQQPDGDVLIVLGADGASYGFLGLDSYWRAVYAVRAWRQGHFRTVVITGGNGAAEAMKEFLAFEGVPAQDIVVEPRALSTRENALLTAPILKTMSGRKVLLTSDFHLYRSIRVFRKAGIAVLPEPSPFAAKLYTTWSDRWPLFLDLSRESMKIVWYRIRGWI